MMKLFLVVLVPAVVYGQQCDFSVVQQCMQSSRPQGAPNMGDMKANIDKCFTDNGCSVPQGPPGGGGGKDKGRGGGGSGERGKGGRGSGERGKSGGGGGDDSCRKKVLDGVKSDLQACVQQTMPGVQLPDAMSGDGGGGMGGDHHGMGGGHHGMGGGSPPQGGQGGGGRWPQGGDPFDRMINDSCKTDAAKAAVKQCLQAYKPSGQGQPQKPDFNAMKQQMCQAKQLCVQKLTAQCQQQLKDVKAAVCQCAKDKIAPKASQIEASLQACGGGGGKGRQGGPPPGGAQGGQQGSAADRFQQMFCGNDAC